MLSKLQPRILTHELKSIYFLEHSNSEQNCYPHLHLPDGTFDLIFNLGESIKYFDQNDNLLTRPNTILIGGYRKSFSLIYPSETKLVGVILQPAFTSMLIKEEPSLISQSYVPAEHIFGNEILILHDQLSQWSCKQHISWLIEHFLLKKVSKVPHHHTRQISHAIQLMEHSGRFNVNELGREIGMSSRNLRRVFRNYTGYSPHEMLRLKRIKNFCHLLNPDTPIRKIAKQVGYYDDAHAMNDFKAVAGMSAQAYLNQLDGLDNLVYRHSKN